MALDDTEGPSGPGAAGTMDAPESLDDALLRRDLKARLFGSGAPVQLGRYAIQHRLGEGGMGVVYAAEDPELGRKVAVKLLQAGKPAGKARMLREAKAMAMLSHPNVVTVHEVGMHGDRVFVAMEFVRGPTLAQWMRDDHSPAEILAVFRQAALGLHAAHRAGLVHRDFKPDNVLISRDGFVKVADFGLAKAAAEADALPPAHDDPAPQLMGARLTRTGHLVGTPAYMPPEQFLGRPAGVAGDVFSFCVALYEAITGSRPYAGDDAIAVFDASKAGDRAPLRAPAVPSAVVELVELGLSPNPDVRPQSMQRLVDAMTEPAAPRYWKLSSLLLAGSAVLGIGSGLYLSFINPVVETVVMTAPQQPEHAPPPDDVDRPPSPPAAAGTPAVACRPYVPSAPSSPGDGVQSRAAEAAAALDELNLSSAAAAPVVVSAVHALVDADLVPNACGVLRDYLTTEAEGHDDEARCLFAQFCLPGSDYACPEGAQPMGTAGCVLAECSGPFKPEALATACGADARECCFAAGTQAETNAAGTPYFAKGCEAGSAAACAHAAAYAEDATRPLGLWVRACELGLRAACAMIPPGGVPRNEHFDRCFAALADDRCDHADPAYLKYIANRLAVRAEHPEVLGDGTLNRRASLLELTQAESAGLKRAVHRFRSHVRAELEVLLPAAAGREFSPSATLAVEVGALEAAFSRSNLVEQERWEAILQRLADERAGFAAAPPPTALDDIARAVRFSATLGDVLEDTIADEIGRERAAAIHAVDGGWTGTRVSYFLRG